MSEENMMTEQNRKTIISFIAGLLVGGLLVFIFSEPAADMAKQNNDAAPEVTKTDDKEVKQEETSATPGEASVATKAPAEIVISGDGAIAVSDQSSGSTVELDSVEFPAKAGWIGVRDYDNGQMSGLLGVARFNTEEGLLPESVSLLRSTEAGKTYAVVFYSDNGDKTFSLATDAQFSGVMETFKAE